MQKAQSCEVQNWGSAHSCHCCLFHRLIKIQQPAVFALCVTHFGYGL